MTTVLRLLPQQAGGTRSPTMMRETAAVLALVERLGVTLSAVHVRGELNVSRRYTVTPSRPPSERVAPESDRFSFGCAPPACGAHQQLELFANRFNHHLPRYVVALCGQVRRSQWTLWSVLGLLRYCTRFLRSLFWIVFF